MNNTVDRKDPAFADRIKERYEKEMLEAIKDVPCEGTFDYKSDNGFAYLNVDRGFGFNCAFVMRKMGFRVRYNIFKNMDPGNTF